MRPKLAIQNGLAPVLLGFVRRRIFHGMHDLIRNRMKELGIRSGRLAARLGYRNVSKGVRRLDQVCHGDRAGKKELLANLPHALGLSEDVVAMAIDETRKQIE
jgi:hypothetical protein